MNIETKVYSLLSNSDLIFLMNNIRGGYLAEGENGIFKHAIPENYRKIECAPFVRINAIYESDFGFSDDQEMAEEQRVQISFWCKNDSQAYQIKEKIDEILRRNQFARYTANENPRYQDSDIKLIVNNRKYRFFDWKN